MVYTGPSRACERCREKKKSCDQQRPECSRCVDAGVNCPGYRDNFQVIYRDENKKAKTRSLAMPRRRARTPTPPRSRESLTLISMSTAAENILIFFHNQFVEPAQESGWPGPLSHLPKQYSTAPKDACFKPALWAASYAILSKKQNDQHYQYQARVFYVAALEAIAKALANDEYDECTMMAIALLDLFQFIMDEEAKAYGKHLNGLRAVLERRKRKREGKTTLKLGNSSNNDDSIFDILPQTQALLLNLRRRTPPSQESKDWVAGLNKSMGSACAAEAYLQFGQIVAQATQLCNIVNRDRELDGAEEYIDFLELISLLRIAEVIDEHNQGWWETHPKWSITQTITNESEVFYGGKRSFVDSYFSIWPACVWNTFRAARIILRGTMMECTAILERSTYCNPVHLVEVQASATRSRQIIGTMVEDIRASIPFVMGQVDSLGRVKENAKPTALSGQTILWPLNVVQDCESVVQKDKVWASKSLIEIGNATGISRLCTMARKDFGDEESTKGKEIV